MKRVHLVNLINKEHGNERKKLVGKPTIFFTFIWKLPNPSFFSDLLLYCYYTSVHSAYSQ